MRGRDSGQGLIRANTHTHARTYTRVHAPSSCLRAFVKGVRRAAVMSCSQSVVRLPTQLTKPTTVFKGAHE